MSESTSASVGELGNSGWSGTGSGSFFSVLGVDDARLVEFDVDDEVESSGISTTFHVCSVASGAKETRRFAVARC